MKKSAIILLMIVLGYFIPVHAQSFCNDEFNYINGQSLNSYFNYPGIGGGYLFGHNGLGDIGKAELIQNPYSSASLTTARLKFAKARTNNPNATISVKIWDNTGTDGAGNPGAPGTVLRTQSVLINTIPTGGTDLVITFTPAITVTTDFFIGITYAYAAGDTVALYANNDGLTVPGTSWEQWGPVSFPAVWYPLSDANNSWGINNSLFISCELCYVCPTVNLSLSSTDNTSCTTANGTVTATASGGTSPYTYNIGISTNTNGQFTGLVGGTYNITATDDVGCTATGSRTISDPVVIVGTSNVQDNTSCISSNGSMTAIAVGGTSPYTYNNGLTTNTTGIFTGLSAGTYDITVTDATGCTDMVSETINNSLPTVTVTQSNNTPNTSCAAPNGAFTVSASGGAGNFSYSANGQTNSTGTFTGLTAGSYTVTATGSDGCSGTLTVTITTSTPTVTVTQSNNTPNTSCAAPNGAFTVSASGGAGNFSYSANGQTNSTGTFTGLTAGSYTVTATGSDGCSGTLSVVISNNLPTITVTQVSVTQNTSCSSPNGAFEVSASGGAGSFTFSANGQTNSTGIFTGLATTTYTVTATGSDGCSGTLTVTVTGTTPVITVNISNVIDNTSCGSPNGSATIGASGGTGPYTIDIGGSTTPLSPNPMTVSPIPAGSYSGRVIDVNGCFGNFSFDIIDNSPTVAVVQNSVTPNTLCVGYNGQVSVSATSGTSPFTYTLIGPGPISNQTGLFTGLAALTYTVEVTDSNGCTGSLSVTVADNSPVISVSETANNPNTSCSNVNGSFTVSASGGSGVYSYYDGNIFNSNGIFSNLASGTYNVTATDSASSCVGVISVVIADFTPAIVLTELSNNDNTSCTSPNGAYSVDASGGTSPYTYNNGISSNQDGIFSQLPSGTYSVTATDANGCSSTISVIVNDNTPVITVQELINTPNSSCSAPDGAVTLDASGGTAPYSYTDGSNTNNTGIFSGLTGGNYDITVTDNAGCSQIITVTIVNNTPTIAAIPSNFVSNTGCQNPNGGFDVAASGGTMPYIYDNGVSSNTTGIFTGLQGGTYNVTVTDANGCSGIVSASVTDNLPVVSPSVSTTPASSAAASDGSASVIASGGTMPYTYNWSNGSTTSSINNVAPATYSVTVTDANGCSAVAADSVGFVVGIAHNFSDVKFEVFPNPANSFVMVNWEIKEQTDVKLELINPVGELLIEEKFVNTKTVSGIYDLSSHANGIYFVKISSSKGTELKRIVLSK
jgi:large repetitive protein